MITVTINGKQQQLDGPTTVAAYVETLPVNQRHLAVAINGEVVPRDQWLDTLIEDGDTIETRVVYDREMHRGTLGERNRTKGRVIRTLEKENATPYLDAI